MTFRQPSGMTNAASGSTLWNYPAMDRTRVHEFWDDFDRYTAADWVITNTEAGAGSATRALTDIDGGCLLITTDDADNDAVFYQSVAEGFLMEVGKEAWFKTRFKVSDATESDVIFGLQVRDNLGDGRLCDAKLGGGPDHAASLRNCSEQLQVLEAETGCDTVLWRRCRCLLHPANASCVIT